MAVRILLSSAVPLVSVSMAAAFCSVADAGAFANNASAAETTARSSQKLSQKARLSVCDAVYNGELKLGKPVGSALCLNASQEYFKVSQEGSLVEVAFIGELEGQTHLCKVYVDKGAGGVLVGDVEKCTSLPSPSTCAEKVSLETQKALVRAFPTIAHSFSVSRLELVASSDGVDTYTVETSDEVESERWVVTTTSDTSASCRVLEVQKRG